MERVHKAWSEIVAWFRDNQPAVVEQLRPPASFDDISAAESAMGVEFPAELKAMYQLADGSDVDVPSVLDDGHWLLPLSAAVQHHQTMTQFADVKPSDDFEHWRSAVESQVISIKGPVKPFVFSRRWVPISTSNGAVHRYVDLDPAPGGTVGQVIEHYPEACSHEVLADSLAEYLEQHAARLNSGRMAIEDDILVDTEADPGEAWEVPEYLRQPPGTAEPADEALTEPAPDAMEMTGDMGMLGGTGAETFFTLHMNDGSEPAFIATRKETKGFGNIAVDQRARVRVVSYDLDQPTFFGQADYRVLEYKVVTD